MCRGNPETRYPEALGLVLITLMRRCTTWLVGMAEMSMSSATISAVEVDAKEAV